VLPLALGLVLFAYLLGSIPSGLLVGRVSRGVDIRTQGSGNIGFTNAVRVLGPWLGGLVFALDFAKGLLGAAAPRLAFSRMYPALAPPETGGLEAWVVLACACAVIAGHNWSVFLRFTGGKGVATGVGAVFALSPWVGSALLVIWAVVVALTRYVSVASLVATAAFPVFTLIVWPGNVPYIMLALAGTGAVFFRHRSNVKRLLAGEERRIGMRKAAPPEDDGARAAGKDEGHG
jgi:acyl phosphate:glycerol-3-phosphate acyltransferase